MTISLMNPAGSTPGQSRNLQPATIRRSMEQQTLPAPAVPQAPVAELRFAGFADRMKKRVERFKLKYGSPAEVLDAGRKKLAEMLNREKDEDFDPANDGSVKSLIKETVGMYEREAGKLETLKAEKAELDERIAETADADEKKALEEDVALKQKEIDGQKRVVQDLSEMLTRYETELEADIEAYSGKGLDELLDDHMREVSDEEYENFIDSLNDESKND